MDPTTREALVAAEPAVSLLVQRCVKHPWEGYQARAVAYLVGRTARWLLSALARLRRILEAADQKANLHR
jgi:hypothetical protein